MTKTHTDKVCVVCFKNFTPLHWRREYCYDTHIARCRVCSETKVFDNLPGHLMGKVRDGIWVCSSTCTKNGQRLEKYCDQCNTVTTHNWDVCYSCSFRNRHSTSYCDQCKNNTTHTGNSCMVCLDSSYKAFCVECNRETVHGSKGACFVCVQVDLVIKKKRLANNSQYNLRNLDEYLNLDLEKWANVFLVKEDRLPTAVDFQEYFGLKSPFRIPKNSENLFDSKKSNSKYRESYHELRVKSALNRMNLRDGIDFHRNRRFLKSPSGHPLEIDFFFPSKLLAIEVQDFKTHSKIRDDEPSIFGIPKRGPKYHKMKRESSERLGIIVLELWEDELKDLDKLVVLLTKYLDSSMEKSYASNSKLTKESAKEGFKSIPESLFKRFPNIGAEAWWLPQRS